MEEMNTMNEVMENTENTTDMVVPETQDFVPVSEDSTDNGNESSGALGAMLMVGAIALAGYSIGKVGEKIAKKVAPTIKNKLAARKARKAAETGEPDEPVVDAEVVEINEPEKEDK